MDPPLYMCQTPGCVLKGIVTTPRLSLHCPMCHKTLAPVPLKQPA